MANEEQGYRAYLIRLWRTGSRGKPVWRASLEDPHTGERHAFASLEGLVTFLKEQIGGADQREADQDSTTA